MFDKAKAMAKAFITAKGMDPESAIANIIMAPIMAFFIIVVVVVLLLPVINSILTATPLITSGPLNATQVTVGTTTASGLGLIVIVILLVAALAIITVISLFQYMMGGAGKR